VLSGCTVVAGPTPTAATSFAVRLNAALAAGPTEFAELFASPVLADSWYSALSLADAELAAGGAPTQVSIHTRFSGDRRTAVESLTLEIGPEGTILGTRDTGVRPLWAVGVTEVTKTTHGTLLAADLDDAGRNLWESRLNRAATAVAEAGLLAAANHWDGALVVELPADAAGFVATTGSPAAEAAAITTCSSGTPRIVINPLALSQSADWLQTTLTHEAVHVATDSACGAGTPWVVEGAAESVAAATDAETAKTNAALVRAYLKSTPTPTALPAKIDTQTDYALAQLAIDQVRQLLGAKAPGFIAKGLSGELSQAEVAQATSWYLDGLRRLG